MRVLSPASQRKGQQANFVHVSWRNCFCPSDLTNYEIKERVVLYLLRDFDTYLFIYLFLNL